MAKKTLITGGQGSGKTTKAIELVSNRNAAWIKSLKDIAGSVWADTEVIVVESGNNISLDRLKAFITSVNISYRKPYSESTMVKFAMPDLIVIDNRISSDARHFDEIFICN